MRVVAIKECPNQLPGSVFDLPDDVGQLFIAIGAVRRDDDRTASVTARPTRRTYRRRDLQAEDTSE